MSVTGIESSVDSMIKAFPNPVGNELQLEMAGGFSVLRVFDSQGRLVTTVEPASAQAAGTFSLDFSGYSKGLYLITITVDSKNYSTKVIKN